MPIYGYVCKSCEHTLDALQKMSDDPLVDCPECGQPGLRRQLSAPRFRLKGKGWYETDFKTDKQRNLHGEKEAVSGDDKPESKETNDTKETKKDAATPAKKAEKKAVKSADDKSSAA